METVPVPGGGGKLAVKAINKPGYLEITAVSAAKPAFLPKAV